jgi:aminopeptidase C
MLAEGREDDVRRREAQREAQQVFNVKLSNEGKPITNQKSSGRCWLQAVLRVRGKVVFPRFEAVERDARRGAGRRRAQVELRKSAFADVLVRREAQREAQQVFNVKLSNEGKPITCRA